MRTLLILLLLTLTACPAAAAPPAKSQPPAIPRTPDGHPDFQGVAWTVPYMAMIEAFPGLPPDLVLPEKKAKAAFRQMTRLALISPNVSIDAEAASFFTDSQGLPLVRGERRTRLLVQPANGRLPLTPQARREIEAGRFASFPTDNPEDRPAGERCLDNGAMPPIAFTSPVHLRRFVQTPSYVAIQVEYGDEVRVIPFASEHGPAVLHPDLGDSIARWDGDALVVETTNFPAWSRLRPFPASLIVDPDAVVTERFSFVSPTELLYQFTVTDPKVYTAPWLAEYSLYPSLGPMFPSSCHEGNYSLPNILAAARQADSAEAGAAQAGGR
jgi:hypothetical protein